MKLGHTQTCTHVNNDDVEINQGTLDLQPVHIYT